MFFCCCSENITDPEVHVHARFPQALLPAPARAKTARFSTRTARVCAEPVLSSTTNWISKGLRPTAGWTASLRSAAALSLCDFSGCLTSFLPHLVLVFQANQRCSTGQVRLAASRECVSPPLYSCNVTCAPYGGSLDAEMGMLVPHPFMCIRHKVAHIPVVVSSNAPCTHAQVCVSPCVIPTPQLPLRALRVF